MIANMKLRDAAAVGIGLNARGLMGLLISGIIMIVIESEILRIELSWTHFKEIIYIEGY